MSDERNNLIDWLKGEIDIYERYHNHKETMAWTATAFYWPAIVGLTYGAKALNLGCSGQIGLSILIPFVAVAICLFVDMQFSMRWKAADRTWGLRRAIAQLFARTSPLSPEDMRVENSSHWPQFVENEIREAENRVRRIPKNFIPRYGRRCEPRAKSELTTYFAILVATSFALTALWI